MTLKAISAYIFGIAWALFFGSGFYVIHRGRKKKDKKLEEKGDKMVSIACVCYLVLSLVGAIVRYVGGF